MEDWRAVLTLFGLISSAYCDLHHWRLNQQPQTAELKLHNWAIGPYHTEVMPNQLVMVNARPLNLNLKVHFIPTVDMATPGAMSSQVGTTYPCRLNFMGRK